MLETQLISKLQTHIAKYGYVQIDTPIIEAADLFLTKAGDQIAERLFTFERHGHRLALRPEFTASAAHRYVQDFHQGIVRWQFNGPIFEDNPHISSQQYQYHSIGAELLGMESVAAEAEIISMAFHGLLRESFDQITLVIGHVGLTRRLLERFNLDSRTQNFILNRRHLPIEIIRQQIDQYFPVKRDDAVDDRVGGHPADAQQMLDVLLDASKRGDTMGGRTRHDIARRLFEKRQQARQRPDIDMALQFLYEWMNVNASADAAMGQIEQFIGADPIAGEIFSGWQYSLELLQAYGIPLKYIQIKPDLARSWDYYTGVVFELRVGDRLVGGGGRYDDLTRLVGGENSVPAVGFAYYLDELLKMLPIDAEPHPIVNLTAGNPYHAIQWSEALRARGFAVAIMDNHDVDTATATHVRVDADNVLHLAQHTYSVEQIDLLMIALKEGQGANNE